MQAGKLTERFSFANRVETDDGLGNKQGEWIDEFSCAAQRTWLKAGESVMAGRLSGRAPAILKIRSSIAAREVTTDWRCSDTRSGQIFNIRQVMPSDKREFIEFLIESGVAV